MFGGDQRRGAVPALKVVVAFNISARWSELRLPPWDHS